MGSTTIDKFSLPSINYNTNNNTSTSLTNALNVKIIPPLNLNTDLLNTPHSGTTTISHRRLSRLTSKPSFTNDSEDYGYIDQNNRMSVICEQCGKLLNTCRCSITPKQQQLPSIHIEQEGDLAKKLTTNDKLPPLRSRF